MAQQPRLRPLAQRLFGPGGQDVAEFFDQIAHLAHCGALAVPPIEPYSVRVRSYPAERVLNDTPSVAGALRAAAAAATAVLEATKWRWEAEGDAKLWQYAQGIASKVAAVLVVRGYATDDHRLQYDELYQEWWPPHLRVASEAA